LQTVDPRAVFVMAVDNLPPAGDNQQQCRPQESPAKAHNTGGAGDAGGFLPDVATEDRPSGHPPIY